MRAGVSNGYGALEEIGMAANGPLELVPHPLWGPLLGRTPPKWQSYFLHPPPPASLAVLPSSQPTVLHSRTPEMTPHTNPYPQHTFQILLLVFGPGWNSVVRGFNQTTRDSSAFKVPSSITHSPEVESFREHLCDASRGIVPTISWRQAPGINLISIAELFKSTFA